MRSLLLPLMVLVVQAAATEPLVGTWTLSSQTANGQKASGDEEMTLRIYPVGDGLEFAFSVPVNGVHMVGLKFTSVHLDGKPGSIEDVRGKKIGDVKVTKIGNLEYKAVLEGPNRPTSESKMTVSADEKTLTSESGGKVQVFSRR
ncbi:MAG TPA: hypothetical protein VG168_00730 [Bryobacteraceae bacterium]|nr:hypothetical protein [Bryobacteraceae bacterium]